MTMTDRDMLLILVVVLALALAAMSRLDGRCHICGAPANARRHASECPWA